MMKRILAAAFVAGVLSATAQAQNADHIATVQSGKSCAACNLFQADLSYRDADHINLASARLRQANLSLATYDDVVFAKSNLSIANLFGARFNRCDFKDADLTDAIAVGTYFGSSDLSGATLAGLNLSGADLTIARGLTQTQLNSACGDTSTKLPKGQTIPSCK
ncbi:MAG: pentapeptide repeat-containing protein [Henriciella sp.]|nr:pentapeptide repeat-containing protein [Henriciella sp.]